MTPQQSETGGVLAGDREERSHAEPPCLATFQPRAQFFGVALEDPLEDGAVQLFLGVEMPVQDQLRNAAGAGHVVHRSTGETGAGKGLGRPPQDRGVTLRAGEQGHGP